MPHTLDICLYIVYEWNFGRAKFLIVLLFFRLVYTLVVSFVSKENGMEISE